METKITSLPARTILVTALGLGFALFGAAIDQADRFVPIQGRPAFSLASWDAWGRASALRIVCGMVIGTLWLGWGRMQPGPGRRWFGHLLFFTAAALVRGSLAAWLNATLEHLGIAIVIGGAVGTFTFAIFELVTQFSNPPPPARLG